MDRYCFHDSTDMKGGLTQGLVLTSIWLQEFSCPSPRAMLTRTAVISSGNSKLAAFSPSPSLVRFWTSALKVGHRGPFALLIMVSIR